MTKNPPNISRDTINRIPNIANALYSEKIEQYISDIYHSIVVPQKQKEATEMHHADTTKYVENNLSTALKTTSNELITGLLQYFSGGDKCKNFQEEIKNKDARTAFFKFYDGTFSHSSLWTASYETVEEAAKMQIGIRKEQHMETLNKLKKDEQIEYLVKEIKKTKNTNEFYSQIAAFLIENGYAPKKKTKKLKRTGGLEDTIKEANMSNKKKTGKTLLDHIDDTVETETEKPENNNTAPDNKYKTEEILNEIIKAYQAQENKNTPTVETETEAREKQPENNYTVPQEEVNNTEEKEQIINIEAEEKVNNAEKKKKREEEKRIEETERIEKEETIKNRKYELGIKQKEIDNGSDTLIEDRGFDKYGIKILYTEKDETKLNKLPKPKK